HRVFEHGQRSRWAVPQGHCRLRHRLHRKRPAEPDKRFLLRRECASDALTGTGRSKYHLAHERAANMTTSRLSRYVRPLIGRDPGEAHRVATPLELFTDLCFVVAVAQASSGLHHEISAGHVTRATVGYSMAFFAIFWAWLNFAWFSSAYDNDDVPFRLLTILQIVGSLMLAAGIPKMIEHGRTGIGVAGYVVMRIALVTEWFRVAASNPDRRRTALRYAFGVMAVQVGWICF